MLFQVRKIALKGFLLIPPKIRIYNHRKQSPLQGTSSACLKLPHQIPVEAARLAEDGDFISFQAFFFFFFFCPTSKIQERESS